MPVYTVRELAGMVEGVLGEGDGETPISGIADLAGAGAGQLAFLGNARYVQAAKKTAASAILIAREETETFPAVVIRVASPSLAFSKIAALYAPEPVSFAPGVHPSAVVSPDAVIGEGASIQPLAVIEAGVRIGARSVVGAGSYLGHRTTVGEDALIYPRVVIRERSVLGHRVIVHSGAVIGSDGFGYELKEGRHVKIPQVGNVQIDDDVEIGANTTIDRGRFGRTWIKRGAKIDNLVMIAHNVIVGEYSLVVAQAGISGSTTLGKYVTLAGQVGLAGHIEVGDRATVTAQSGVTKDIPAKAVLAGRHAVPLRESLRLEALFRKLPELWERIRALEKKAGTGE